MKRMNVIPVGGISLLVIFTVLCLTVFAWLGLSSVQAEGRLCTAAAEAIKGYYEADYEAEQILARLRAGEVPASVEAKGNCYRYKCKVSEVQTLVVEVEVQEESYRVLQWKLESAAEWTPEDGAELWDGEFE